MAFLELDILDPSYIFIDLSKDKRGVPTILSTSVFWYDSLVFFKPKCRNDEFLIQGATKRASNAAEKPYWLAQRTYCKMVSRFS